MRGCQRQRAWKHRAAHDPKVDAAAELHARIPARDGAEIVARTSVRVKPSLKQCEGEKQREERERERETE